MIQSIIKFGLEKPILNYMLLLFVFILSVFSYMKIPKEIFPISSLDAISINGNYAGASSDILNKLAVQKIEDELGSISEADTISTVVKTGFFSINIKLKSGYKVTDVMDDIKDIVTKIRSDLPTDMDEPTVKEITSAFPLVTIAIFGDKSREELIEIADSIKTKVNKIGDLSEVTIWGDSDKELLITFDEAKIEAYGLNKALVVNTIANTSSIFPAGIIKDKGSHYYLSSQNGEKDLIKLNNTILKFNTQSIYLKDIANIEYKLADVSTKSHYNGKLDMSIGINKGRSGDSIALVKEIKEILEIEQKKYSDVTFDTYTDTSIWIKNRLNTVVSNILFGIILLSTALFFFINFRIAFVVAIGIPTSFMIGLVSAEQLGYSLNMLSLLGALLALGMLVDEAIVVAENIYRHLEMGKDKMTAALDGATEMFPAVLTATATTIFAFLPILLMTGETGVFMRILPIMISVLLVSSLLEAFFFLPLHAKHSLKVNKEDAKADNIWTKNKKLYRTVLSFLLKWKYIAFVSLLAFIIVATMGVGKILKFEFMPDFDTTQVYVSGSVGVGHDIDETEEIVLKLEKKLLDNFDLGTEIDSISSVIGLKLDGKQLPQNEEFYFQIFVNLQERAPSNFFDKYINPYLSPKYDDTDMTRIEPAQIISDKINEVLKEEVNSNKFPELNIYVPGAGIVSHDIELSLNSQNKKALAKAIVTIEKELALIKGITNIANDVLIGNKELKFSVNSYGQRLGFTESGIVNELKPFYFKASFAKMYDAQGIVEIVMQSKNKDLKSSLDQFELTIPNSTQKVLLKEIVTFQEISTLSQIFKEDGTAIQSITASISGDITSDEVYTKLQPTLTQLKKTVTIDIKGEQKENKKVQEEMAEAALIAIVLIFISLVWMFDSIIKSFIILSTIPLSILGVLIGHLVMGLNLTMPGLIGMVGLAGVIVNDGIIMMDFIKKAKDIEELKEYALLRLRPILLTSLTTILGLSTLIFFASGQSLILQPMAVALGFGILWATVLNLYYVPMLYRLIYLRESN
ncbi:efflux RND transporter permease subunit [Arcobacter sp. 15-2]|uniref:efflux RND transporter permease subunit n=1 Tax=Arcobacter sp. 15-2 TaxID=3374109 RepID=UPI00399D28CB